MLGDNTDGGTVMLRPIMHQDVGIWISAGLPCTHVHSIVHHMHTHLRLLERKYCVSAGCLYGSKSVMCVLYGDVTHVRPADI